MYKFDASLMNKATSGHSDGEAGRERGGDGLCSSPGQTERRGGSRFMRPPAPDLVPRAYSLSANLKVLSGSCCCLLGLLVVVVLGPGVYRFLLPRVGRAICFSVGGMR